MLDRNGDEIIRGSLRTRTEDRGSFVRLIFEQDFNKKMDRYSNRWNCSLVKQRLSEH